MGRLHATYGYWNTFAGMTYADAFMDLRSRLQDPVGEKFSDKQLMQAVLHSCQTMYSRLVPIIGKTWLAKRKLYENFDGSTATMTKPADCGSVIAVLVGSDYTDSSTLYQARPWPLEKVGALTSSVSHVPSATKPYMIEQRDYITLYPTPADGYDAYLFYIARPPWAFRYYRGAADQAAENAYQLGDDGVPVKTADYWEGCIVELLDQGFEGQRIVVESNTAGVAFNGAATTNTFTATPDGSVTAIQYVVSDPLPLPAEYHPLILIDAFISLMRAQPGAGDPEKMQSAIDTLEEQMNERFKEFVLAYDVAPESP